ncbi:MAG: hypothetical protein GEU82_17100 [Luteitalea sp.]|nr:hypothetical protein [Luteitalea sp.]
MLVLPNRMHHSERRIAGSTERESVIEGGRRRTAKSPLLNNPGAFAAPPTLPRGKNGTSRAVFMRQRQSGDINGLQWRLT